MTQDAGCIILYSEDMQQGLIAENNLSSSIHSSENIIDLKHTMCKFFYTGIFTIALIGIASFSNPGSDNAANTYPPDSLIKMPEVIDPDITIVSQGKKICQLIGEYDREQKQLTQNQTYSRYKLRSSDLGVPFRYAGRTYLLFGDTNGDKRKDGDAVAFTTDTIPEDGISLTFIHDDSGIYKPVTIPGISQGAFEVSTEGIAVNDKMYIYSTTDHSASVAMGRSVVSRSDDNGQTFHYLYDFSTGHFINVSIVKTPYSRWKGLPGDKGEALILFGSGTYRKSDVYLACQPALTIEQPGSIRYFTGVERNNKPVWSMDEQAAVPLFHQSCVGELSVSYNTFIDRWIMLYNCSNAINMRTARYSWGPWTKPQVLFDPRKDGGYCHFMHVSWQSGRCDSVMDSGRENVSGGVYGPYQFEYFAKGDSTAVHPSTTIYFTMSTWNPYTVVLMKATLKRDRD